MNGSGISFERSSSVFCAFLQHLSFFGGLCQAFNQTSNFKISRIFRGSRNFLTTGKTRNLARVQILPRYYEITERLLVVDVAVVVVADVVAVVIVAAAEVVVLVVTALAAAVVVVVVAVVVLSISDKSTWGKFFTPALPRKRSSDAIR